MNNFLTLLVTILFCITELTAQHHGHDHIRCASHHDLQESLKNNPHFKEQRRILESKIQEILSNPNRDQSGDVIVIPTVFHVIHDGDAIGSNENISSLYLNAQLEQLNDDFRRLNSNSDNTWSQAADTEIEFCLAQIDPNGNPTPGIIRHNISGGPWTKSAFKATVMPATIWDNTKYLNLYTADLSGGLLGFGQFPGSGNANTDGVVCRYTSIGSIDTPNPSGGNYTLGRTATHEVGHWLNLSHIWGDDSGLCSGSDLVDDTPNQGGYTSGCPSGIQDDSCSPNSTGYMYQNYMDYTYDACMNLFTLGQKDRMHAAIAASRPGLIDSQCAPSGEPPVADFTELQSSYDYCGGGTMAIYDTSTGSPSSWYWTFSGAGVSPATSTAQNPVLTISGSGNMTVSLTVTNTFGSDTKISTTGINVFPNSHFNCLSPCLAFENGPYNDFNNAGSCFVEGCEPIVGSAGMEVHAGDAFILTGLNPGTDYNFEFCTNYSGSDWNAVITLGEYDAAINGVKADSELAWNNGCSLDFTVPTQGDYVIVVTEQDQCGTAINDGANGVPTLRCIGTENCGDTCGSIFTDKGGLNLNYSNNTDETYTICPDNATCETSEIIFTAFKLENGVNCAYDYLGIYDGDDITAPHIGNFCGAAIPGPFTSTHSSGCLTIVFHSDSSVSDEGWEAIINCVDNNACNNCPINYSLYGSEYGNGGMNNNGDFETDGTIVSYQTVADGVVDYDSATSVELGIGFEAKADAEFNAFIDGCNNGFGGGVTITGEAEEFLLNHTPPEAEDLSTTKSSMYSFPKEKVY